MEFLLIFFTTTVNQIATSSKNFKNFKKLQNFIVTYQKQNLKQDIRTVKNPSTTKSTKMTRNYRMNSGKLKLQKKSQS